MKVMKLRIHLPSDLFNSLFFFLCHKQHAEIRTSKNVDTNTGKMINKLLPSFPWDSSKKIQN